MPPKPTSNPNGATGSAAAPALASLESLLAKSSTPDQFCAEVSRLFHMQPTQVALLRLDGSALKFLFPMELAIAGTIPISSASAIAAHTAVSKTAEIYNNFPSVKHASIFEKVKLGAGESIPVEQPPIQRLMSAPVTDAAGKVRGVIQVCRKGPGLSSAGPEFTPVELRLLEGAAAIVVRASFMQKS